MHGMYRPRRSTMLHECDGHAEAEGEVRVGDDEFWALVREEVAHELVEIRLGRVVELRWSLEVERLAGWVGQRRLGYMPGVSARRDGYGCRTADMFCRSESHSTSRSKVQSLPISAVIDSPPQTGQSSRLSYSNVYA